MANEASHGGFTRAYMTIAVCSKSNPNIMFEGSMNSLYKSTNGGESWQNAVFGNFLWETARDFDGKTVTWNITRFRDDNQEANLKKTIWGKPQQIHKIAVCANNPDYVAYTEISGCTVSTNCGATWDEVMFDYGEQYKSELACPEMKNFLNNRPPSRFTHKEQTRGAQYIVPTDLSIDPFNSNSISIAFNDIGLNISRDGGTWWEWAWEGIIKGDRNKCWGIKYDSSVKNRIYALNGPGWNSKIGKIYQSDDGGTVFRRIGIPEIEKRSLSDKMPYHIYDLLIDQNSLKNKRRIYVASEIGLYKTEDGGENWASVMNGIIENVAFFRLEMDPKNSKIIYAGSDPKFLKLGEEGMGLYKTEDSGNNWSRLYKEMIGGVRAISICKKHPENIIVLSTLPTETGQFWSENILWKSSDYGNTWSKLDKGHISCAAINSENPEVIYQGKYAQDLLKEKVGIFRTKDNGKTWQQIDENTPNCFSTYYNKMVFSPHDNHLLYILHDSGVWELQDNDI